MFSCSPICLDEIQFIPVILSIVRNMPKAFPSLLHQMSWQPALKSYSIVIQAQTAFVIELLKCQEYGCVMVPLYSCV